jgi:RNA polymerase sigma factor (sigma-70 family)
MHHRLEVLAGYRPMLVAIAGRVGLDEHHAEDAVHDALLKVANADTDLSISNLPSYAARAVQNTALNLLRDGAQHTRVVEHATLRPDTEQFEDQVLTRIIVSDLLAAMAEAESATTVEILILWAAGYPHAEIAELLGMSVSAIQSRHHRALKRQRDAAA